MRSIACCLSRSTLSIRPHLKISRTRSEYGGTTGPYQVIRPIVNFERMENPLDLFVETSKNTIEIGITSYYFKSKYLFLMFGYLFMICQCGNISSITYIQRLNNVAIRAQSSCSH